MSQADRRLGVLVTGASSGLGSAIASNLAARGFIVGCLSRRGLTPDSEDKHFVPYAADVRDTAAVAGVLENFARRVEQIVGLVNNAGMHRSHVSVEMSADDLRAVLELNFISAFECCRIAYPYLRKTEGVIVNIGSLFEKLGIPGSLAYCASKAAIGSLTRTLAVEWARDGISVITVAPGYIRTGLNEEAFRDAALLDRVERKIPLRRIAAPDEIGRFVTKLFVDPISYLTGSTLYIDGGQGIAP